MRIRSCNGVKLKRFDYKLRSRQCTRPLLMFADALDEYFGVQPLLYLERIGELF